MGANIWGKWHVADASCSPYWAPNPPQKDGCVGWDTRQYSSQIFVPWGNADAACWSTALSGYGTPQRCTWAFLAGLWGQWDKSDTSCRPHWGDIADEGCAKLGKHSHRLR